MTLPEWPRALGVPSAEARLRSTADDFEVTEELGFAWSGDGDHDVLFVEKTELTTHRVAGLLARHAGVPRAAVGYAGLKDRRARTRQWFTVKREAQPRTDWSDLAARGLSVLSLNRNRRKLKRGAHRGNRFRIVLRELEDPSGSLPERLRRVRAEGVPNYFGEQRFGVHGNNVALAEALFAGRRLPRAQRSMALSAARSLIFNEVLAARVADGSWNALASGDVASLDGSGSVFVVEAIDDELERRARTLDLHPSGPLWGAGAARVGGASARLEARVAAAHAALARGLERETKAARRALRVRVKDLDWCFEGGSLVLDFALVRGAYATAVVRELVRYDPLGHERLSNT